MCPVSEQWCSRALRPVESLTSSENVNYTSDQCQRGGHRIPAVIWTQSGIIDASGFVFKVGVMSWLSSDAVELAGILRE